MGNPVNRSPLHLKPLPKLAHIGPQLSVAVGLTGLDNTGRRMPVIDVEANQLVHREPAVQVGSLRYKFGAIGDPCYTDRKPKFRMLCGSI